MPKLPIWSASRHAKTTHLISQPPCQNCSSELPATKNQNFNKTTAYIPPLPCGTADHHCGIGFTWVYLWLLLSKPGNPTTSLKLCSSSDYRYSLQFPTGVPTFNSTKTVHRFTIWYRFVRIRQKYGPFGRGINLSSATYRSAVPLEWRGAFKELSDQMLLYAKTISCLQIQMARKYCLS